MIQSQDELRQILQGTSLERRDIAEIRVLDTDEQALAVDIEVSELEQSWKIARGLLEKTGRWPVVSTFWGGREGSFVEMIEDKDFFSRFYFEEAPNTDDVSPKALIETSRSVDVSEFVDALANDRAQYDTLDQSIAYELEHTRRVCGNAPSRQELKNAELEGSPIDTTHKLDRWLLDWELEHGGPGDPEKLRFDWFEPLQAGILFLPTSSSWETLAYINWFGTSDHGSEKYIALGKSWEQRFGAELLAHYGTMLQCMVSRPPPDPVLAWPVAREHDLTAPCTLALPGISLRHYASGLSNHGRWFLHERP